MPDGPALRALRAAQEEEIRSLQEDEEFAVPWRNFCSLQCSKKHQVLDPAPAAYRRQTSKEMLPDLREAARQTPTDLGMCEAERPRELKRKRMEVDKNRSLRRARARDR